MSTPPNPLLPINGDVYTGNLSSDEYRSPVERLLPTEEESDSPKDYNNNSPPSLVSRIPTLTDSHDEHAPPPPPTTTQVCESSSSSECLLIPKHAVVDDVSLKFILHPNLAATGSSSQLCTEETRETVVELSASEKDIIVSPSTKKREKENVELLTLNALKRNKMVPRSAKKSCSTKGTATSTPSSGGEQYVIKTAKEILYDIAQGKWNRKGMMIDEECEGIKKVGSKPCSNANCVRAAERDRRKRDQILFQDFKEVETVFEDGHLPSYHSLLNVWKCQEDQKHRHTWIHTAFKNGFPQNEAEFLKVWRECRKNPEAFGITKSKPEELPEILERRHGSRVRKLITPYNRSLLAGQAVDKRPPIRLASKEYYDQDWKPVRDSGVRQKTKSRYDKLRRLYPHLPALRDTDYKMNPATVKHRLKQAEEWHKLVTVTNKPTPMVHLSHYATATKINTETSVDSTEFPPGSAESSELDFQTGPEFPRYASFTTSSMNKMKQCNY